MRIWGNLIEEQILGQGGGYLMLYNKSDIGYDKYSKSKGNVTGLVFEYPYKDKMDDKGGVVGGCGCRGG